MNNGISIECILIDAFSRLRIGDSTKDPDAWREERPKFVRGLQRLFDRFAADGKFLPTICELTFTINACRSDFAIGPSGDFEVHSPPNHIYGAAWRSTLGCGCSGDICCGKCSDRQREIHHSLCDQPIKCLDLTAFNQQGGYCRSTGTGRALSLWYQESVPNGQILFDCSPFPGDTFVLWALMPFDQQLDFNDACEPCKKPDLDEWEWSIDQCACICCADQEKLFLEARKKLEHRIKRDCKENEFCVTLLTNDGCDPCGQKMKVTVRARRKPKTKPDPVRGNRGKIQLPAGYRWALVALLAEHMAPELGSVTDPRIAKEARDARMTIFQRNSRIQSRQIDTCLPWNVRHLRSSRNHFETGPSCLTLPAQKIIGCD